MILGGDALDRLRRSHVAVFGLGGVGSYVVEALCRAGVGELTLIDGDTVSVTNINRQLYALHSTVGQPKAEAAAAKAQSDAIFKPLVRQLSDYIKAHPEQFAMTRAKKTPFGSYGLRKVSDLEITDEAALLKSLMAHDLKDGYEVTTKIVKKAVERMVRSGDTRIAGAVIRKGERVGYTVKKELLDNAKNTGVQDV